MSPSGAMFGTMMNFAPAFAIRLTNAVARAAVAVTLERLGSFRRSLLPPQTI